MYLPGWQDGKDTMPTTFAVWLRATGHTHRGLTARALLELWKAQR